MLNAIIEATARHQLAPMRARARSLPMMLVRNGLVATATYLEKGGDAEGSADKHLWEIVIAGVRAGAGGAIAVGADAESLARLPLESYLLCAELAIASASLVQQWIEAKTQGEGAP